MKLVAVVWFAANLLGVSAVNKVPVENRKVVCYYTNWSVYRQGIAKFNPQNINPYLCTHLIYAFGGITDEYEMQAFDKYQDFDKGGYSKFVGLKSYNNDLKVSLALGGWNEGSKRWSSLVEEQANRKVFIRSVIKTLRTYSFDGLDLDWEYPAFRDGGNPEDKENYVKLVQELSLAFTKEGEHNKNKERLFLSMAVPAGIEYIEKGFDVEALSKYLDFFNVLSYDYHGAYESFVDHHAPLFSRNDLSEFDFKSQLTIDYTINYYISHGVPPEKLILGIPTYGRTFKLQNPRSRALGAPADGPGESGKATKEDGFLAYYEICENVLVNGWKIERPDPDAIGPYAYKGNQWVGYDDEDMVRKKARYVVEKGLGGIMFWSIDNDDFRGRCSGKPFPLIEAAKEALLSDDLYENKARRIQDNKSSNAIKSSSKSVTSTTPEPPTTPDPGADFTCAKEGYFVHPHDCKKYFWCLNSNIGLVAHQFTCPAGLFFSKGSGTCDFSRNVICKPKPVTPIPTFGPPTSSTEPTTFKPKVALTGDRTIKDELSYLDDIFQEEKPRVKESEVFEDPPEDSEEGSDVSRLTRLLQKLGGIDAVEALLTDEGEQETPSHNSRVRGGGGRGPQFVRPDGEGDENPPSSIQYVTLQRTKPSGSEQQITPLKEPQKHDIVEKTSRGPTDVTRFVPQYVTINRNRPSTEADDTIDYYNVEVNGDSSIPHKQRNRYDSEYESEDSSEADFHPRFDVTPTTPVPPRRPNQRLSVQSQQTTDHPPSTIAGPTRPVPTRSNNIRLNLRNKTPATPEIQITTQERIPIVITRVPSKNRGNKQKGNENLTSDLSTKPALLPVSTSTGKPVTSSQSTPLKSSSHKTPKEDLEDYYEYYDEYYEYEYPETSSPISPTSSKSPVKVSIPKESSQPSEHPLSVKPQSAGSQLKNRLNNNTTITVSTIRPASRTNESSVVPTIAEGISQGIEVKIVHSSPPSVSRKEPSFSTTVSSIGTRPTPTNRRVPGKFSTRRPALPTILHATTRRPLATRRPTSSVKVSTEPPRIRQPLIQREKVDVKVDVVTDSTPKRIADPRPILIGANPASKPKPSSAIEDDYEYDYELFDYIYDFSQLDKKIAFYDDGTFECLEHGTFPHPISCRKFISCVKVETGGIRGWIYKCPSSLVFDPVGNMCNWEEKSFCTRS